MNSSRVSANSLGSANAHANARFTPDGKEFGSTTNHNPILSGDVHDYSGWGRKGRSISFISENEDGHHAGTE
ncbi:MAG: hypothetical protein HY080_15145 [Gammaproteobacteria bacterium]|nr:hypothetical protein [Gammaproteobacteria bacterium]